MLMSLSVCANDCVITYHQPSPMLTRTVYSGLCPATGAVKSGTPAFMQQPRVLTVFGLTFWVLLESLRRVHPRIRQCLHVPARWCEIETPATPHTGMARRFCGWATPGGTVSVTE